MKLNNIIKELLIRVLTYDLAIEYSDDNLTTKNTQGEVVDDINIQGIGKSYKTYVQKRLI